MKKSIEAIQKEYKNNSNPIAAFMDECTQISDEDCDSTILYLKYVDWCNSCGKQHLKNIGFSRKLIGIGYTSHRENVQDGYCVNKITKLDNLKIKQDRIEQIRTGYENAKNLSCHGLLDI